jgi:hypothetical protein
VDLGDLDRRAGAGGFGGGDCGVSSVLASTLGVGGVPAGVDAGRLTAALHLGQRTRLPPISSGAFSLLPHSEQVIIMGMDNTSG